jgi:hypothetical protein
MRNRSRGSQIMELTQENNRLGTKSKSLAATVETLNEKIAKLEGLLGTMVKSNPSPSPKYMLPPKDKRL